RRRTCCRCRAERHSLRVRALVKRLSPAVEFVFVITAAFGLPIVSAVWFVAAGHRRATMSNGQLVGIWLYEIAALCMILPVLRARGWSRHDFEVGPSFANTLWGLGLLAA